MFYNFNILCENKIRQEIINRFDNVLTVKKQSKKVEIVSQKLLQTYGLCQNKGARGRPRPRIFLNVSWPRSVASLAYIQEKWFQEINKEESKIQNIQKNILGKMSKTSFWRNLCRYIFCSTTYIICKRFLVSFIRAEHQKLVYVILRMMEKVGQNCKKNIFQYVFSTDRFFFFFFFF
jgi:hypothetical protein